MVWGSQYSDFPTLSYVLTCETLTLLQCAVEPQLSGLIGTRENSLVN